MAILNVKQILDDLVSDMFAQGKTFYGRPITSLRPLVSVEGDQDRGRVLVPYWWGAMQKGRGARKSTQTEWTNIGGVDVSTFQRAIYNWMQKHGRFTAKTDKGKINEAKGVAWYINKHGNKHYRDGKYIDIYDTLVTKTVDEAVRQVGNEAYRITSELVKI